MSKILSRRMILILSLLALALFGFTLNQLQILPLSYFGVIIGILLVLDLLLYKGQQDKEQNHKVRVVVLKLVQVLLSICLIFASLNILKGNSFISRITGGGDQVMEVHVAVLKTSSYQKLSDLKEKPFGMNKMADAMNVNKAEAKIEDEIGDIDIEQYSGYKDLGNALVTKDIEAILVKDVDYEALNTFEKGFTDKLRIVHTVKIIVPGKKANSAKVTKEPFNVLISGTDKSGPIDTYALSDVNMIATVNPTTKQVLLTSIPRDYYVDIKGMDGVEGKDKLTHSARGGINCTSDTIENLMDIEFNYYAKFNFTSFLNVIDALGGITVDVPKYDVIGRDDGVFTTVKGNYTIHPGKNDFDSKQALSFVRERKSFVDGDDVRGENQMLMLKAIIKKCTSPAVIKNLDGVLDSLADCFETNMSSSEIKSLINMQIKDMAAWDIQSYRLAGDASHRAFEFSTIGGDITSTNANGLYVTEPDPLLVEKAKGYIQIVEDGEEILKIKDDDE